MSCVTYDVKSHFVEGGDKSTFVGLKPAWRRNFEKQVQATAFLTGLKPTAVLTGIKARPRDAEAQRARLLIEHDVDPITGLTQAYRVWVLARRGPAADTIRAMRKRCTPS